MAYVLIVDDDEDFAHAVCLVLQRFGHEVHMEAKPDAAMGLLSQRKVDLLILDVMFPEEPSAGFRLCEAARRAYPGLAILMVTAINTRQPLGFTSGPDREPLPADAFLEKPVDLDVLAAKATALLADHGAARGPESQSPPNA